MLRAAGAVVAGAATAIAVAAPAHGAEDEHYEHRLHTVLRLTDDIAMDSARYVFENTGGWTVDGAPSGTEFLAWTAESDLLTPPIQATMVAHVVENGLSTPFWVRVVSARDYDEGFEFFNAGCEVFRGDPDAGGTLLDPAEGSPYTCTHTGTQYDPGEGNITTLTVTISSLIWTTVRGTVMPQSGVTLTNGTFQTSAPHTFIDGMPQAIAVFPRELGFLDQLTWTASARNGESTDPARAEFAYDIQDDDEGGYSVTGWASTGKDGAYFDHGADCDILRNGQPVTSPPFRCEVDGLDLANGGDWQAVFRVSRVSGTDLGGVEPTPTAPAPPAVAIPPSVETDAGAHPTPTPAPAASLAQSGTDASPQTAVILGAAALVSGAAALIVSVRRRQTRR